MKLPLEKNKLVDQSSAVVRIAVAGTGVVGSSVIQLLQSKQDYLLSRCGRHLLITDIAMRNVDKPRLFTINGIKIWSDAEQMAQEANVDLVVELIGGQDGVALKTVIAALKRGIPVVTANKAMLAHHGLELAKIAELNKVSLGFEAAVAGGIPIVKALKEGLAANTINKIYGILNGTCNYILTQMYQDRLKAGFGKFEDNTAKQDHSLSGFDAALQDAQVKGYAEADPTFDIEGIDAAHKLTLLSSLAFGVVPDFKNVNIRGIKEIESSDIDDAQELNCRIKLLGMAQLHENGSLTQQVSPFLVDQSSPIAAVDGVFNGVVVSGDFVGESLYEGRGAGGNPTASAVVADIIDVAKERKETVFGISFQSLQMLKATESKDIYSCWYIRLAVIDRPGVVADISTILAGYHISLDSILQRGRSPMAQVNLVLATHEASRQSMNEAIEKIMKLDCVVKPPQVMQIMK